jgi:predicted dithiol-disulfide oxidoreductase (DUF899 family)
MKTKLALPKIVSRAEWNVARKKLLPKEKAATRARDALNAERRRLPMVQIEKFGLSVFLRDRDRVFHTYLRSY